MNIGRFISVNDFSQSELYYAIQRLLNLIIIPEFESLITTNDFNLQFMRIIDVGKNIQIELKINAFEIEIIVEDDNIEAGSFLEKYIDIKDIAMSNIRQIMVPIVKKEYLNEAGLSEDQFIIRTLGIRIRPNVKAYVDAEELSENHLGNLFGEILFTITINIEDISELEPEGFEFLKIKYNNLCGSYTTQSFIELEEWGERLGITGDQTKESLCEAIRDYYNF